MPRVDYKNFDSDSDENRIRVKTQKPRNPMVQEMYDGRFPPKKHKDKRRSPSKFDSRNIDTE